MVSLLHAARLGEDVAERRAYVAEGQGNAPWLADVLQQTELSFLRTALGEGRRVLSKPGYEIDTPWYDMGALNDAGLVVTDT